MTIQNRMLGLITTASIVGGRANRAYQQQKAAKKQEQNKAAEDAKAQADAVNKTAEKKMAEGFKEEKASEAAYQKNRQELGKQHRSEAKEMLKAHSDEMKSVQADADAVDKAAADAEKAKQKAVDEQLKMLGKDLERSKINKEKIETAEEIAKRTGQLKDRLTRSEQRENGSNPIKQRLDELAGESAIQNLQTRMNTINGQNDAMDKAMNAAMNPDIYQRSEEFFKNMEG